MAGKAREREGRAEAQVCGGSAFRFLTLGGSRDALVNAKMNSSTRSEPETRNPQA